MKLNNNDDSHNSGLNLLIYNMLLDIESHPAWVCGLKRTLCTGLYIYSVTPCVGVWIETFGNAMSGREEGVTPCVGVWIETPDARGSCRGHWSHPAWVCGLKLRNGKPKNYEIRSHPAWVCGLKL